MGSQTCHRDLDAWPCPGTHPLSGSQEEDCQCPCRAALSVLRFELVVIEVVHQVLGEFQNAHAHIHRAIEH